MTKGASAPAHSPRQQQKQVAQKMERVTPPPGVFFHSDDEEDIFYAFSRARAPEDWREADLLILHRCAQLQVQIVANEMMIRRTGPLQKKPSGAMTQNPLVVQNDNLTRQLLACLRGVSLNEPPDDIRTINNRAKLSNAAAKLIEEIEPSFADGLLAKPMAS